jgi:hypothetical protein
MAARARAVEARLSDALHARLTERFVNRRTSVLMKKLGPDAALLPVALADDEVLVDGEPIGHLAGFRFRSIRRPPADRKLLLAAAERHLAGLAGSSAQTPCWTRWMAANRHARARSGTAAAGTMARLPSWKGQAACLRRGSSPILRWMRLAPNRASGSPLRCQSG